MNPEPNRDWSLLNGATFTDQVREVAAAYAAGHLVDEADRLAQLASQSPEERQQQATRVLALADVFAPRTATEWERFNARESESMAYCLARLAYWEAKKQ